MNDLIRRRDFIILLGGAALTWPRAAHAQQSALPVVGVLKAASSSSSYEREYTAAFRRGLSDAGYVEGRNVAIEWRWGEDRYDRLPELAADLVRRRVAVIAAQSSPAALAAKAATAIIPIVFGIGGDPVEAGLVASLNHPRGNITGVTVFAPDLGPKRLELLRELAPTATTIGLLSNPRYPSSERQIRDVEHAARATGRRIVVVSASTDQQLNAAFTTLVAKGVGALIVTADVFFGGRRERIVALAAQKAMPAIYHIREFADAGGLISYGNSNAQQNYQVGVYVGRILGGAKTTDLPVVRATKFELVINMNTAKTLGLTIPPSLQLRADQVIQ